MKVFSVPRGGQMKLAASIAAAGLAPSRAEAERLIKQGAVEWNGTRVNEATYTFDSSQPADHTLRVGKRPAIILRIEK